MTAKKKQTRARPYHWSRLPREQLLDTRICDLGLQLAGSALAPRIARLQRELQGKGLSFQPHFWLSDEWFCADGIPGVALPFYLAHPRLRHLEQEFMMEVEGGDTQWCMKLLRHETGHALLNAYALDQRADWRRHFGQPNRRYPDSYLPQPYSKRYVVNLPDWYAQAHPHEDWAETFAVWLNPATDWRNRYRTWPALKKLEFIDGLMREIGQRKPRLRNRRQYHPVEKIRTTLRAHYADKTARYSVDSPEFFDTDLRKLFVDAAAHPRAPAAAQRLRAMRAVIISTVDRWSGENKYRINIVLKDMIRCCEQLDLRCIRSSEELLPDLTACVTMLVLNKLYSGGFHYAL